MHELDVESYLSSDDIEDLFSDIDEDSDDQISYMEFQESWHKIREEVEEHTKNKQKSAKRKAKMQKIGLGGVHTGLGKVSKTGKETKGIVTKPKKNLFRRKKKNKNKD